MKKTLNINISGQLFRIDEEAYQILSRYMEHISKKFQKEPGGEETIADIETRIAEIFGGGCEPPRLVSKEMVDSMIGIMGAPEEYSDDGPASGEAPAIFRKAVSDSDRFLSEIGQLFANAWRAVSRVLSGVLRILAVTLGTLFTIVGFFLLFTFGLLFFFTDTPMMQDVLEQNIMNVRMLLGIALNGDMVQTVWILAAIVVLVPLASLSYLGIKLIFKIRQGSKPLRLVTFVTWIMAVCALAVLLTFKLSIYANHEHVEEKAMLEKPPRTLYIAPLKKSAELAFDEKAAMDDYTFWKNATTGQLFGTVDLNIYGSDSTAAWLTVNKTAFSKNVNRAYANARSIEFAWKVASDTLYMDEYFSLPAHSNWNGSSVFVYLCLPENTSIKAVSGSHLATWRFHVHDPEAMEYRIDENGWARPVRGDL
jgi:hypothetical protein